MKKINLAEIKNTLKTEQVGVVNVKQENITYNFYIQNPEVVKRLREMEFTPEFEAEIKSKAEKSLTPVGDVLNMLNEATTGEIVVASTVAESFDAIKKVSEGESKGEDEE